MIKSLEHVYEFQPDYANCKYSISALGGKTKSVGVSARCALAALHGVVEVHCADQGTALPPQHRRNAATVVTNGLNPPSATFVRKSFFIKTPVRILFGTKFDSGSRIKILYAGKTLIIQSVNQLKIINGSFNN